MEGPPGNLASMQQPQRGFSPGVMMMGASGRRIGVAGAALRTGHGGPRRRERDIAGSTGVAADERRLDERSAARLGDHGGNRSLGQSFVRTTTLCPRWNASGLAMTIA